MPEPTGSAPVGGEQPGSAPAGEPKPGSAPVGGEPGSSPSEGKEDITSLPEWAQKKIGALNAEAKQYRTEKQKAESDKKTAEEANLKDQAQWKTLAEKWEKENAELKAQVADFGDVTEMLREYMNREIESWPEEVKSMAPDSDVSPREMGKFLDKARPVAAKMLKQAQAPATPKPGNGRGPDPINQGNQGKPPVVEPVIDVARKF